jgi:hypothetical protein
MVPSWASPVELAAASFAHPRHLVLGIAVRQNSSFLGRAAAPAWAWSRVHSTVVALCPGQGSMTLEGVAVDVAVSGGNGGGRSTATC